MPDITKRIAQELVVNDKVAVLAGFGLTPLALATAPIATQSKTPLVVMAAATSSITEASPFIVRTSFTLPQAAVAIADWAPKNGIKKVVTLVTDYGPGIDAEKFFKDRFAVQRRPGGREPARAAAQPRLRAVPAEGARCQARCAVRRSCLRAAGAALMKQFAERGLDKAGIKLIGTGDVTDDDILNGMGDVALGVVTSHHYSTAHNSPANKKFVEAFTKANNNLRPNFMAVGGYDGMRVIYEALKKTKGDGRRPGPARRHEGPDLREPARPDVHRRADARRRAQHLHPQGREEGRPALQRGVRRDQGCEGPGKAK